MICLIKKPKNMEYDEAYFLNLENYSETIGNNARGLSNTDA